MERLVSFLLERRLLVVALAGVLAAAGGAAWWALPVDAFPDVTNIQVMVIARAEGLGATDVERRVTYPIEQQMGGLPRVTLVRSMSRAGLAQVVVVFEDGVDPWFARQVVFERLEHALEQLPPGVDAELGPLSTGLGEIFQYTVEGEGLSLMERRSIQDWLVAPRLRAVHGVTEVNSLGGEVEQVQVVVSPDRLLAHGLTLRQVEEAVARGNVSAGAGYILRGWEQMVIRGEGLYGSPSEILDVVLATGEAGTPVVVGDVADVTVAGPPVRQGAVTRDGEGETVGGMVIMLRGENSRAVVESVKGAVADLAASLPEGARLDVFYDRTELVRACLDTVTGALGQGAVLVVLVLALFLAEVRTAAVVVLSLPVTFLAVFLAMRGLGLTANLMTVGGLAFAVGMVVDASIVIAENVRRHLAAEATADRARVIARAVAEVARPVTFSILVIALVLLPLLGLEGLEGRMFGPLALALLLALVASLGVALVVVPPVADLLLARREPRDLAPVRALTSGYHRLLDAALGHPRATLAAAVVALLLAIALVPGMGTTFLPELDEGSIAINVVRLPNASVEGSVVVAGLLERRLLAFPEVATVVTKTGRPEIAEDPMGPEQSDVFVMLKPRREWTTGRSKAELVDAMAAQIAAVPGLRAAFSQPIALRVNELVSGVKTDLAVKVFGPNLEVLKTFADRAAVVLRGIDGARDVTVEQVTGMVEVVAELDRQAMARWGLAAEDVTSTMEAALAGRAVTRLIQGERRIDVVVRFPPEARHDLESLSRLLVPTPSGATVTLGRVARLRAVEGPMVIGRENGMRRVVVERQRARPRPRLLRRRGAPRPAPGSPPSCPPGAWVEYGGQFEQQQRAMRRLAVVVPVSLAAGDDAAHGGAR